jgi:hypothetical protein
MLAQLAVQDLLAGRDVYTNFQLKFRNVLWLAWRRGHVGTRPLGARAWDWLRGREDSLGKSPDRFAMRDLARRLGRWRVMRTYEDMISMREGLLHFDEAHMWLWARAWKDIPRRVISWWSQSRKHGVDVRYATQRYESVDAHVRELTSVTWHCRRIWNSNLFIYQMEDMESEDRSRRIWKRQLMRLDPAIANCYDTYEVLDPPWEVAEREAEALRRVQEASKRQRGAAPRRVATDRVGA